MSWDNFWNGINDKLEQYGGFLYDVNAKLQSIKQEIKDKTDDTIKNTAAYKEIENEISYAEQSLENVGAKIYDVQEKANEFLKSVGAKTEKTSKYFFWGTVGVIGLIIYSKLK